MNLYLGILSLSTHEHTHTYVNCVVEGCEAIGGRSFKDLHFFMFERFALTFYCHIVNTHTHEIYIYMLYPTTFLSFLFFYYAVCRAFYVGQEEKKKKQSKKL